MGIRNAEDTQKQITREMRTCKHFTGIQNKVCEAGVVYETVFDYPEEAKLDPAASNLQLPCLSGKYCRITCEKREFPTLEEATAEVERSDAALEKHLKMLSESICPTHEMKVTKVQVGRCVYAKECGCRLYQGKA